jgi:hypothetical protein
VRAYLQALKQRQITKQAGCKFFNLVEVQVSELQNTKRGGFFVRNSFRRACTHHRQTHNQNKESERANRGACALAPRSLKELIHINTDRTKCKWMWNKAVLVCREIIQQHHCRSAMKRHRKSRARESCIHLCAWGWGVLLVGLLVRCWIRRSPARVCSFVSFNSGVCIKTCAWSRGSTILLISARFVGRVPDCALLSERNGCCAVLF